MIFTIIVNEANLDKLIPLLEAYGVYMYEELGLTAGKEKFYKELHNFPIKTFTAGRLFFINAL